MKVLHLEARSEIKLKEFNTTILPKSVCVVTTIQYINILPEIKKYLETNGISCIMGGQVLGCDASNALKHSAEVEAFIYFGSGRFHPIGLAKKTNKPLFTLNPESQVLDKISDTEVAEYNKRKLGAYTKFLASTNIGVMITKKSGQCQVQSPFEQLFKLKKQFPDKKFYFLLADTFDFSELENFNFIETTINTM